MSFQPVFGISKERGRRIVKEMQTMMMISGLRELVRKLPMPGGSL
jgi:hypothetical protein